MRALRRSESLIYQQPSEQNSSRNICKVRNQTSADCWDQKKVEKEDEIEFLTCARRKNIRFRANTLQTSSRGEIFKAARWIIQARQCDRVHVVRWTLNTSAQEMRKISIWSRRWQRRTVDAMNNSNVMDWHETRAGMMWTRPRAAYWNCRFRLHGSVSPFRSRKVGCSQLRHKKIRKFRKNLLEITLSLTSVRFFASTHAWADCDRKPNSLSTRGLQFDRSPHSVLVKDFNFHWPIKNQWPASYALGLAWPQKDFVT